jgi:hypothetical protein
LFLIISSSSTSNLNPNRDHEPWPSSIFTLTYTKCGALHSNLNSFHFSTPYFLSHPPSLHLISALILNLNIVLSLLWHVPKVLLLHSYLNSFYFSASCFFIESSLCASNPNPNPNLEPCSIFTLTMLFPHSDLNSL